MATKKQLQTILSDLLNCSELNSDDLEPNTQEIVDEANMLLLSDSSPLDEDDTDDTVDADW